MDTRELPIDYETAMQELEQILDRLARMDCPLEQVAQLTQRARLCLDFCQQRLRSVRETSEKVILRKEEL